MKHRIQQAQTKAVLSANLEMLLLYWDVGRMIQKRQKEKGWGAGVIPRLSRDLRNELPEIKGYSERNLKRMIRFYREYPFLGPKVPQPVAQLSVQPLNKKVPQPVAQFHERAGEQEENIREWVLKLPWSHNFLFIEKFKDLSVRRWYMQQIVEKGRSRDVMALMIEGRTHERQGKAISNFDLLLPTPQSDMAKQALKDPYIFDFLTLDTPFRERELEVGLIRHLEKFLLELLRTWKKNWRSRQRRRGTDAGLSEICKKGGKEVIQDHTSVNLKGDAMKGGRELVPIELIQGKNLVIRWG
ncbi:MAG: PDDEXK nuclease domain-containing protein [Desulfatiglandales bacterium]